MLLEISQNSQENKHLCQSFFFNESVGMQLKSKIDSDTGVSCEFCEILKNTYFLGHLTKWYLGACQTTIMEIFFAKIDLFASDTDD